jgi:hypothetical protein
MASSALACADLEAPRVQFGQSFACKVPVSWMKKGAPNQANLTIKNYDAKSSKPPAQATEIIRWLLPDGHGIRQASL